MSLPLFSRNALPARDIALVTSNIVQHEAEAGRARADIVISPQVARVSLSDFSHVQAAYDAGVAAAEAPLPQLQRDVAAAGA